MKFKTLIALSLLSLSVTANARILGVTKIAETDQKQLSYYVQIEICPNSYPTIEVTPTKLSDDSALIALNPYPGTCENPSLLGKFTVNISHQLEQLGLDPQTAKIFIQMQ